MPLFAVVAASACDEHGAPSVSSAPEAIDEASSLASAIISTPASVERFERITALGPRASRTLRSASRDVAAENFLTFMQALQQGR